MYASYERPTISMSICYYNTEYRRQTAECVLDILKRNQMFRPSRMDADHLTGGRMKKYTPDMEELFLRAYGEPDVLGIAWESGDYRSGKDYMGFLWSLTFLKNSSHIQSSYHPWNVLSFTLCYLIMNTMRHLCSASAFQPDILSFLRTAFAYSPLMGS